MGRPKHSDRPRTKEVSVPGSLLDKVDSVLTDPHTGKVGHGRYSRLTTILLADWLVKVGELTPLEAEEYRKNAQEPES